MNNEREIKCWGSVIHVFASDHAAISCLWVEAGHQCSRHYHVDRANQFTVMSGCIEVEEWDIMGDMITTVLSAGGTHAVPSGRIHRFRVLESGQVVEVYWCDFVNGNEKKVRLDDIVRLDEGGPIHP